LAGGTLNGGGCKLGCGGGSLGSAGSSVAAAVDGVTSLPGAVAAGTVELEADTAGSGSAGASLRGTLIGAIDGTDRHGGGSGAAGPGPRLGLNGANTALVVRLGGAFGGFFDSVMCGRVDEPTILEGIMTTR
jgi:hypothetical protein